METLAGTRDEYQEAYQMTRMWIVAVGLFVLLAFLEIPLLNAQG